MKSGGRHSLVSQGVDLQGKAAEIAGLSRREFLEALFREQVPACQVTIEELAEELEIMARVVRRIVDASPLILLGKIGRLDLLRVGGPEVMVPGAVLEEVGGHEPDEAAQEIVLASWIRVAPSDSDPRLTVQAWDLGAGGTGRARPRSG